MKRPAVPAVLGGVLALCVAAGCGGKGGLKVANHAPHVRLTAGPVDSTTDNYSVPFQWTGWDDDGSVDHFLYSIDGGDSSWSTTRDHTTRLVFSATTQADSATFTDWHTFYVKAVDNEGAESAPASVTFNALTIAPSTHALKPTAVAGGQGGINSPLLGGTCVRIEWEGEDPDGVVNRKPVAYEIVRAQTVGNIAGRWFDARDAMLGPDAEVTRVDGSVGSYSFCNLTPAGSNTNWAFWVRAIDEAGAVEPWPQTSGHWPSCFFFFFAQPNLQGPQLSTTSKALGRYVTQGVARDSVQFVYDRPISFQWEADASNYGADIDGYRWGVDVSDLEDPRDPGWATGWNRTLTSFTGLTFTDRSAAFHTLIIQAQDSNGGITTQMILLELVTFEFDRDVLFVDDEFENGASGSKPTNAEHEAYTQGMIGASLATLGRPLRVDTYTAFPDTINQNQFRAPRLTDFSRYRVLVWDTGQATSYNTLYRSVAVGPATTFIKANPIAIYLESGGNLIIAGSTPARSTVSPLPSGTSMGATNGLAVGLNNFAIDYWHLPNKVFFTQNGKNGNGQISADPTDYARSNGYLGGYPQLVLNSTHWYVLATAGIVGTEALDLRPPVMDVGEDALEPLYTYGSASGPTGGSYMQGLIFGQLFKKAPQNDTEDWQYQVAYFGTPWYFFQKDGTTAAMTNLLASMLGDRKWQLALAPPPAAASGRTSAAASR